MKNRVLVADLKKHAGKTASVSGWLYKRRLLGGLNFLVLRDRTGLVQILLEDEKELKKLDGLQLGTVLTVTGEVLADDRAPGGVEIHDPQLEILSTVKDVMPIEIDKPISHKPEHHTTLFENRTIGLRNTSEQLIFKIQAAIERYIREYFESYDFVQIHTPKLLAEPTEGGAEVFKMDYFGKTATLAQSPQFYKQMMVGVYERVYEIGPVYRAEPSTTTRHMSEYISVDGEMGFITELKEVCDFLGGMINFVCEKVWSEHKGELEKLQAKPVKLTKEIPEITLSELHEQYFKATNEDTRHEKDPTPAEERFASEYALKKWGSEAVYITEFPASEMKFYHRKNAQNSHVADRADLIFRGVEITTLSMRENNYETLLTQLEEIGGDPKHPGFKHYLQAFQYGMPSHGGFGLGLERLTQKIIGLENVKEATLFPRDMQRLAP
ncbi:MAG: aspartate--tRNA(Asn) ligase [Candidatus Saccharibacteria bacterium]